MKNKIFQYMAMGVAVVGMTACNDFLDRVPQSDITPSSYFTSEADLSAYVINQYTFTSIAPVATASACLATIMVQITKPL